MNDFLKDCLSQTFTNQNLQTIWNEKNSDKDIVVLETDLPIRYKKNLVGSRNIELMSQSQFGVSYKTIALVEDENMLLSREFYELSNGVNFGNFNKHGFKSEINVMMGAFSIQSLILASQGSDVNEYVSNGGQLEMVKAFDGTMQNFVKQPDNPFSISSMKILPDDNDSSLDGQPLASFDFTDGNSGVRPTNGTHQWLERLVPQRLIEIFTIEQMPWTNVLHTTTAISNEGLGA